MRTALPALLILATAAVAAPPATTQSLEQRMIDLAPVLSIDDPQTKSLDVQMVIGGGKQQMMVRALYGGDGESALYISDPTDGTPLLVIAGGRLIAYDPIDGVLRTADNASASLHIRQEGKEFKFDIGFAARRSDKPPKPWTMKVDLASIVKRSDRSDVQDLGGGTYGLRQRGEKSILYAAIDPERSCPYLRLEITDGKGEGIVLDPVRRNEPVDPSAFAPPTRDELAKRIPVREWPGDGILARAEGMQAMMLIILARIYADDPKMRAELRQNWVTRVNWAKVKENDEKFAPILGELFPLATAAPSGSGATTKPAAVSNDPAASPTQ